MTRFSLLCSTIARCRHDIRGNTSVLFAVAVLPVLGAVGAGIDYARFVTTNSALQAEADRLALAAQLQQITSDERLKSFVRSQITDASVTIVGEPNYDSSDGSMCLTLTKRVPTVVMQVIRFAAMNPVVTACSITGGGGSSHYEIALALDNTGSMSVSDNTTGRSKIQSEITAAKNFVDQMFTAVGSQHVDISVVPFTTAVNVGTQYANASWMDTSGRSSIHWENFPKQNTTAENDWNPQSRFDMFTEINQSWAVASKNVRSPTR